MTKESFDVIILGGGPAGLTSAIYTSRHGLNTLVIEGTQLGGKSWGEQRIENYPGFPHGISGTELMERFIAQAKRFGTKFKEETITGLMPLDHQKFIQTRAGVYEAKAVIIATGIQKKQLSIPGENEFKGRGVSYCAICDGHFFANKVVAVIGDGSISSGMAFEALNQIGHLNKDVIIVLNDNEHSISKNVGALSHYLIRTITDPLYNRMRKRSFDSIKKIPRYGLRITNFLNSLSLRA